MKIPLPTAPNVFKDTIETNLLVNAYKDIMIKKENLKTASNALKIAQNGNKFNKK